MAAGKQYVDDSAAAIVEKWRKRLANGWEPSVSDVLRHLDGLAEAHEREVRAARDHPARRVRSKT